MSMQSRKLFVAIFLFCTMVTSDILASGFYVARFGGEHGHPTTDNLSAIYYNPAGLSLGLGLIDHRCKLSLACIFHERPEELSTIHYRTSIRAKRVRHRMPFRPTPVRQRYRIKLHPYRCRQRFWD